MLSLFPDEPIATRFVHGRSQPHADLERLAGVITTLHQVGQPDEYLTNMIASLFPGSAVFLHVYGTASAVPVAMARTLPSAFRHGELETWADRLALEAANQPRSIQTARNDAHAIMSIAYPSTGPSRLVVLTVIQPPRGTIVHEQHKAVLDILAISIAIHMSASPSHVIAEAAPLFSAHGPLQNPRHEARNHLAVLSGYAHLLHLHASDARQHAIATSLLDRISALDATLSTIRSEAPEAGRRR